MKNGSDDAISYMNFRIVISILTHSYVEQTYLENSFNHIQMYEKFNEPMCELSYYEFHTDNPDCHVYLDFRVYTLTYIRNDCAHSNRNYSADSFRNHRLMSDKFPLVLMQIIKTTTHCHSIYITGYHNHVIDLYFIIIFAFYLILLILVIKTHCLTILVCMLFLALTLCFIRFGVYFRTHLVSISLVHGINS